MARRGEIGRYPPSVGATAIVAETVAVARRQRRLARASFHQPGGVQSLHQRLRQLQHDNMVLDP